MDTIKLKTMFAGIWGGGSMLGSWIASEQCGIVLGNIIKLLGVVSILISIIYVLKINRLKERIKALDEVRIETRMCSECLLGKQPPGICPIPLIHRPKDCPKELQKAGKTSALQVWRKKWGLNFTDDTSES